MTARLLELTGTFVLVFPRVDPVDALTRASALSTAALGLLFRYLAHPPRLGILRAELAEAYGLTIGQLRRGNDELIEGGYLLEARRSMGRGRWQHLIIVTDTPGQLPIPREGWTLLDAALAAEQAHTPADSAHVVTCDDVPAPQVTTSAQNDHIEPVNPFSFSSSNHDQAPAMVATVAQLRDLAKLPPLPAPEEQGDLWLTPAQVLGLADLYPERYLGLALGVLAKAGLQWYLAPRVMALLIAGYDTGQLARALAGVHDGEHPAAIARWRLDRMQLAAAPEPNRAPAAPPVWRAPSTTIAAPPAPSSADPETTAAKLAAIRAKLPTVGAKLRAGNRP